MFNLKKINKFRRNVKAISPVISVLLMIAVAVVASLVAYAWVMGYMNFQTAKTGQAIQIQSVTFTDGVVTDVYVQNVGDGAVIVIEDQCLYINGVLDDDASVAGTTSSGSLIGGQTATITSSSIDAFDAGQMVTIKVTTEGGTYSQISQVVPDY